jgi:hypothetical protein
MRPTSRPAKPYTNAQIKAMVTQHFFVENNPRCTIGGTCVYTLTGCIVGAMLIAEDAATLHPPVEEGHEGPSSLPIHLLWASAGHHAMLSVYFTEDQVQVLGQMQRLHDRVMDAEGKQNVSADRPFNMDAWRRHLKVDLNLCWERNGW